jgi:hypothetical protein
MKKHKHHIIPKHAGGTDDPSNIVELTVSEHTEEHRKLWEEYGRIEDKVAWNMLSGRKMSEEDRILLAKSGFSKWRADQGAQVAWRNNIVLARASQVITEEHKTNIKKGMLQAWSEGKMDHRIMDSDKCREIYFKNDMGNIMAAARRESEIWRKSVTSEEYRNKKRDADPRRKSIIVDGIEYPSIRSAAKATSYSYNQLRIQALSRSQN